MQNKFQIGIFKKLENILRNNVFVFMFCCLNGQMHISLIIWLGGINIYQLSKKFLLEYNSCTGEYIGIFTYNIYQL
jgi:hypothetical protein